MTVRKLTAAAVFAALAAAPSIAAAQAQPLPPQRPGAVAPADKDDNPAAGRWARSGSATADLLMTRAQTAMKEKRLELAIELLDRVISLDPDWAEGWNQRANALFLAGDSIRSMLDIGETLKREPRHYGAMMGLGTILRQQGDDKRAMVAYRRALEIYPQLEAVKNAVDSLKIEVDGRDA
ncbi:MAG: hypothetical protein B7Z14_07790 [Bosea sp. 32-68-6]|nr:MAG: hypothetical protein B7Z14_07790 [Bosea sp. 32-68-6]